MYRSATHHAAIARVFPAPKYLTMQPVGIDISPQSVTAMRLKQSKYGLVPDVFAEEVLAESCELLESEADLKRCEPLKAALVKLQASLKLQFVKVSVPEMKTYIFKTTLPEAALPTIEDALTVKLQENVPLDPQDMLYDFHVLPQKRGQQNIDVVVTVFPKNVIAAYTALLTEVGLVPIAFESESQSNARAVVQSADDTSYLLMHMGRTKVSLAIVERGAVHYTSSIPYASEEIVKDFTAQPAQALKAKINTLLVYWFTNRRDPDNDEKITNTILTGPFANAPGLIAFLEKHLRINVDTANVWRNCFDINEHVPAMSYETSLAYSTAVGLALLDH